MNSSSFEAKITWPRCFATVSAGFLNGASLDQAPVIADRLRRDVEASSRKLAVPGVSISVSIGVAAHKGGTGAQAIMQEADRSLYAAKHDGRNAVVIELKRYRAA